MMLCLSATSLLFALIYAWLAGKFFITTAWYFSLGSHSIACILTSYSCKFFLMQSFKKVEWSLFLFFFLLCFFLPLFGIFMALFIAITMYSLRTKYYKVAEIMDDAVNLKKIDPIYAKYGEGGAYIRLQNQQISPLDRTKAFFDLAQWKLSELNRVLYNLLPDTSDEIRLLSFNILDQQEVLIQKDIKKLLSTIESIDLDEEMHAKFEKNLAMLYWELSYCHLVLSELEHITLKKALAHALFAVKHLDKDAMIFSLSGKIYFRLKQYAQAEAAFQKAKKLNIAPSQILPYLAEIKFGMRDFVAVKKCLDASDTLLDITRIAPVKHFWDKDE